MEEAAAVPDGTVTEVVTAKEEDLVNVPPVSSACLDFFSGVQLSLK